MIGPKVFALRLFVIGHLPDKAHDGSEVTPVGSSLVSRSSDSDNSYDADEVLAEIADDIDISRTVPSGSHPGTRREQLCLRVFINSTALL